MNLLGSGSEMEFREQVCCEMEFRNKPEFVLTRTFIKGKTMGRIAYELSGLW